MGKIYFASDFHLGLNSPFNSSEEREKLLVSWLLKVAEDAERIYLVGDLFDFWFEYKYTAPKGFVRFLGTLASIKDSGISIEIFTGNHDMWMFDYLEKELGVPIHRNPISIEHQGKKILLGHGDGLGPGDHGYKFIKKVFANPVCQWLFARIHPNLGFGVANFWSKKSRVNSASPDYFLGVHHEWLVQYCHEIEAKKHYDYYVFGHRHLPIEYQFGQSKYINLGDWLKYYTYGVLEDGNLQLMRYRGKETIFTVNENQ